MLTLLVREDLIVSQAKNLEARLRNADKLM
jgi:hypothetical protein